MKERGIGLIVIDPFITAHLVPENDNTAMDRVMKVIGQDCRGADCAIELVHHAGKGRTDRG